MKSLLVGWQTQETSSDGTRVILPPDLIRWYDSCGMLPTAEITLMSPGFVVKL